MEHAVPAPDSPVLVAKLDHRVRLSGGAPVNPKLVSTAVVYEIPVT